MSHQDAYLRAVRLMRSAAAKAFELEDEPASVRDAYGRTAFGQGCLLARRLVERGVPFVEVTLSSAEGAMAAGWDTHQQNFDAVKQLSEVLDPAWAALMDDLRSAGLLDSTLIVWMGEFGRTPKINPQAGRDHFPAAWTTVLAGGGIKGGQVIGSSGADGMEAKERPVAVPDFLATVCKGLGIDPMGAERFRPRPADPDRRPQGQTDPGGAGMNARTWPAGPGRAGRARARAPTGSCGRQPSIRSPARPTPTEMRSRTSCS